MYWGQIISEKDILIAADSQDIYKTFILGICTYISQTTRWMNPMWKKNEELLIFDID